jgi:hypothetical protein
VSTATRTSRSFCDISEATAKWPWGTFAALNEDMSRRQHLTIRALAVALIAALALLPHNHGQDKAASAESNAAVAANR